MRTLKSALFALAVVVGVIAAIWLVVFGTAAPCDAMRAQVPPLVAGQPKAVVDEAYAVLAKLSPLQCAAIAIRLKAGDSSVLQIAVVGK